MISDDARIHERNAHSLRWLFDIAVAKPLVDKIFDQFVDILEDYPGSL